MWRGFYLLRIPTLARKSRLFLEWNWAMFFPPDVAHLGYRRTQGPKPVTAQSTRANGVPGQGVDRDAVLLHHRACIPQAGGCACPGENPHAGRSKRRHLS
jgi:hypothetical protein